MNRLHAVLLVVGLLHGASTAQDAKRMAEPSPARKGQAAKQPERQQYPTENSPLPVWVIETPSDEADRKRRQAEAAKHEDADLKAQERSAAAAEEQVSVGKATALLSFFGLAALIWTLWETRRAAGAAVRAASAAELAVSNADQSAEKQLRAYINVRDITVKWRVDPSWHQHVVSIKVKLTNKGQTPARHVRSWVGFYSSSVEPTTFGEPKKLPSPSVYGPDQSGWINFEPQLELGRDLVELWRSGKENCYVWGKVEYEDVFKHPRETFFRYMMTMELVGDAGGNFSPCNEGNDYT